MGGDPGIEVRSTTRADAADLATIVAAVERAEPTHRDEIADMDGAEAERWFFQSPAWSPQRSWMARTLEGAPVGWVGVRLPMVGNRHHVQARVEVVPAERRKGIGSALLAHALEAVGADDPDRSLLAVHTEPGVGAGWCEALGLASKQLVRKSRVDLAELDLDVVRGWLDPPEAVDAGYRVVGWRGPTPDRLVAAACVAITSMADAPTDDADHESVPVTPELLRQGEAAVEGRLSQFGAVALAVDGSGAGYTELGVVIDRPVLGDQGDTVVVADHRGHRLGRWLKAVNLLAAIDAHPELRFIDTFNAESNPWMLSINEAMGYRPHAAIHVYQGPLAGAREHLARRATVV
jgi:GNAT superfamily N-acetyltransferase